MTPLQKLLNRRGFIGTLFGCTLSSQSALAQYFETAPPQCIKSAAAIGKAVLNAGVVEGTAGDLRAALAIGETNTYDLLCNRWMKQIRDDFTNADTVYVSGWTLSQTEARLYALVQLSRTEGRS